MVRVHQVIPSYTLGYILVYPTPLIRVDKQKEKIMQKVKECMIAIESKISALCEEKLTAERLLRDQLELLQDIEFLLYTEKPDVDDIYFTKRGDAETTITIKSEKFSDQLSEAMEKYMNNRPYNLRGKVHSLDVRIDDLCQAWQKLDDYIDMGFIDLGEKTASDFVDKMMQYIGNMG